MKCQFGFVLFVCLYFDINGASIEDIFKTKPYIEQLSKKDVHVEKKPHEANIEDHIYTPCETNEHECITYFFASNSHCVPKYRAHDDHDEVYRERQIIYLPHFDLIIVLKGSHIRFESYAKIQKFYVNKKTQNLIMVVEFKGINIDTEDAYFEYLKKGDEPVVTHDRVNVTYDFLATASIPIHNGISMKDARIVAHDINTRGDYIGPKILDSKDPIVREKYRALIEEKGTTMDEVFLTEAASLFYVYLQKVLCDFGIPISA